MYIKQLKILNSCIRKSIQSSHCQNSPNIANTITPAVTGMIMAYGLGRKKLCRIWPFSTKGWNKKKSGISLLMFIIYECSLGLCSVKYATLHLPFCRSLLGAPPPCVTLVKLKSYQYNDPESVVCENGQCSSDHSISHQLVWPCCLK